MERQVNFLNSLITNKSLLFDFLVDPMKIIKISEVDKDPVFEKFALNLYRKLCDLIEADFTRLNESGDEKFRKIMLNKRTKKLNCINVNKVSEGKSSTENTDPTDDLCEYNTSECTDWTYICTYTVCQNEACGDHQQNGQICRDSGCDNVGETPCTDSQLCTDTTCFNNPGASNFCQDFTGCHDFSCINAHCGDIGACTDAETCHNIAQCQDGGSTGCADNACLNSSTSGTTKCTDSTNCLDSPDCSNIGSECSDSEDCRDTGCSDSASACSDNDCEDNQCSNESGCADKNSCIDTGCTNDTGCKNDGCIDSGCVDTASCSDSSNCSKT